MRLSEPRSTPTFLILAALVALGPMATDMYLPALPQIARSLGATPAEVQLTLSVFLFGFALAQLFYGPLSDRFGRKPVMLGGMAVFAIASIGCALVESASGLIALRLLQALGGSVGPVLGRAMVRDIYGAEDASRVLSHIASIMALAPAVAPIIGGVMAVRWGWASIFWALAGYGALVLALFAVKVAESAPRAHRQPRRLRTIWQHQRHLLSDRSYMGFTLGCACAYAALFAFLSGSSFVLIGLFGVSEIQYGWLFLIVVVGYFSGAQLGARLDAYLGRRGRNGLGMRGLGLLGSAIMVAAASLMCGLLLAGRESALTVVLPMAIVMLGVGLVMPQSMAGALRHYPHIAGTASGLLGFIQMSTAGLVGVYVGHSVAQSALPMALVILAMSCLSWAFLWATASAQ